jgi:phosphoglycolate phosphatase
VRVHRPIPFRDLKLWIFDLDGTLIDSRDDLVNSVNSMLRHVGHKELPPEIIASYIGDGAPTLVRRALGDPDDEDFFTNALNYFLAYYREHKLDHTYVYDGVFASLDAMRAKLDGAKLAVLTNKPVAPARAIIDALGLGKYFFQVYGGNSFHTKKPDPHGVEALLEEAGGIAPGQAVIIGDSAVDMLTARNTGIYSVGCTFGLSPHTLEDLPGDVMVDSPSEWKELLD